MSTEDTNRVGGAEFSAEKVRRKLVEIADAVIGRPVSAAEMMRLTGDDEVPDPWAHEPGTVVVHGFGFEDGGYSFTVQRVSETEHSDNPIAATKVYGPKKVASLMAEPMPDTFEREPAGDATYIAETVMTWQEFKAYLDELEAEHRVFTLTALRSEDGEHVQIAEVVTMRA